MATRDPLRTVIVILTSGCNLACRYCYQNAKQPRSMDWETLRAAIDLLLRSRRRTVTLSFYGGEPLLELRSIRRAVDYVREVAPRGKIVRFAITTNGTLLDDDVVELLARNRFITQISFDGMPAAQDQRGRGTFPILDALLERLRSGHPDWFREYCKVALTVNSRNLPHLGDSIAYFLRKRVSRIDVQAIVTHDPDWRDDLRGELDRQWARACRACRRHYLRTGEVPLEWFRKTPEDASNDPEGGAMCGVRRGLDLTVDVDGSVRGCVMFAESYQRFASPFLRDRLTTLRMGNIRAPDLALRVARYRRAARAAGLFDHKEEKYSSYGHCGDCPHRATCNVCPVAIGYIPGNTDPRRVPDSLCAFTLAANKYRERFPEQPGRQDFLRGTDPLPEMMRELAAFARVGALR